MKRRSTKKKRAPEQLSEQQLARLPRAVSRQVRGVIAESQSNTTPTSVARVGVHREELTCGIEDLLGRATAWQLHPLATNVWQICNDTTCDWVLKVHYTPTQADRAVVRHELDSIRALQGTGLVPRLVRVVDANPDSADQRCTKQGNGRVIAVLERWDMDAETLGTRQFERLFGRTADAGRRGRPMLLLTESQIRALFALAQQLGERGYEHAHLHPANIMYRLADDRFFIVGLGRSTDRLTGRLRCPLTGAMTNTTHGTAISASPAAQSNIWQLLVALGSDYPAVLVAIEDPATRMVQRVQILLGLGPRYTQLFPRTDIQQIAAVCTEPDRELVATRRQEKAVRQFILEHIPPFVL